MANALDFLAPDQAPPAPAVPPDVPVATWDKADTLAPIANLGNAGVGDAMWQGGDNLYHATRAAQDVAEPIPEDLLWGTTGQAAPPLLATPRAPEAASAHLAGLLGGGPNASAFVSTLGQAIVSRVAAHANPGGDLPVQGENQAAAVALARWRGADEQGLLKGDGFAKAKTLMGKKARTPQETADLVEAVTRFEDATQWIAHPEMALHPLVGVKGINMDAGGTVKVTLGVTVPNGTTAEERLANAHPGGLVDPIRAQLVEDWKRNVDEGNVRRWRKDKSFPHPSPGVPESVLTAAYKLAGHELGVAPDEVRGLVPIDREKLVKSMDNVEPIDWRPIAGTVDPKSPSTQGTSNATQPQIEIQPDGTQRVLGSWKAPLRGLAQSPFVSGGAAYMVPAEPAKVPSLSNVSHTMDWDGFADAVKPGYRVRIDAGGEDPERDHRAFLAKLNRAGITPKGVGLLNPVSIDDAPHLPMVLEFKDDATMREALGEMDYPKADHTAYGDVGSATWESWVTDDMGRHGRVLTTTPGLNSVAVQTSRPAPEPDHRIDSHAQVLGTTPDVEVKVAAGIGPFAVEVNGSQPKAAYLAFGGGAPAIFYGPGQPPVEGAVKITPDGRGVQATLPDVGDGKVDPLLATQVESLLTRMGVNKVAFSG